MLQVQHQMNMVRLDADNLDAAAEESGGEMKIRGTTHTREVVFTYFFSCFDVYDVVDVFEEDSRHHAYA
jgi:hypothetical protein